MVMFNYIYCENCRGYKTIEVDKIEDLTPKPYGNSPTSGIVLCNCSLIEALDNAPIGWACPRCHMVWKINDCNLGCPKCPPVVPSGFPITHGAIPNVTLDSSPDVGIKIAEDKKFTSMNPKNGDGGGSK